MQTFKTHTHIQMNFVQYVRDGLGKTSLVSDEQVVLVCWEHVLQKWNWV